MPPPILACPALIEFRDGQPHLRGSRCADCGEVYFPAAASCTRCLSTRQEAHDLGCQGSLWSWTIQGFLPKAPYNSGETADDFQPYGVGYVQMADGIKVESRLTVADEQQLRIGMPLTLTLIPYRRGAEGEVMTFAFAPTAAQTGVHHG